jgi:hypothetical protein
MNELSEEDRRIEFLSIWMAERIGAPFPIEAALLGMLFLGGDAVIIWNREGKQTLLISPEPGSPIANKVNTLLKEVGNVVE